MHRNDFGCFFLSFAGASSGCSAVLEPFVPVYLPIPTGVSNWGGSFKLAVGIHAMKLDWCIALCHGLSFVFGIILLGLANQLIDLMP